MSMDEVRLLHKTRSKKLANLYFDNSNLNLKFN